MSLRTHIHHGWAELVLADPPRNVLHADPPRNVLHADLLRGLAETLVELAAEAPVLLLRSQGRHFSTGYPIGDIPEEIFHEDAEVRAATPFETVMQRLVDYPAPVIMAVQGDAWGGAVEMLACADLRVAAAGVRVALTPARLGLIYSHTGLRRLGRALGSPLLREMVLTGLPVTTDRLERTGFFSRVVTAEDLESCTGEMVDAVLCGGPQALRGTRHVLRILEETENLAQEELAKIARLRHRSRLSAEFNDAQAAFLEGRPSPFRKGE